MIMSYFYCEYCYNSFTTNVTLENHINNSEYCLKIRNRGPPRPLSYTCEYCNEEFTHKHFKHSCKKYTSEEKKPMTISFE